MSFWDQLFGGGKIEAAKQAQQGFQNAYNTQQAAFQPVQQNLNPYIQAGQQAMGQQQNYWNQNQNPQQTLDTWMKGYNQTPYAQYLINQAEGQANNAAAMSGTLGSLPNRRGDMQIASDISGGQMNNYLGNLYNQQGAMQNNWNDILGRGAQASNELSQYGLQNSEQLAQDQANMGIARGSQDEARSSMWGNLFGNGLGVAAGMMHLPAQVGSAIGKGMTGQGQDNSTPQYQNNNYLDKNGYTGYMQQGGMQYDLGNWLSKNLGRL